MSTNALETIYIPSYSIHLLNFVMTPNRTLHIRLDERHMFRVRRRILCRAQRFAQRRQLNGLPFARRRLTRRTPVTVIDDAHQDATDHRHCGEYRQRRRRSVHFGRADERHPQEPGARPNAGRKHERFLALRVHQIGGACS